MKKILLLLISLTILINVSYASFPSHSSSNDLRDLFVVDIEKINEEMEELDKIESYVVENQLDFQSALETNPTIFLTKSLNLNTSSNSVLIYGEPPLGIPSFVWGMCCGFAGLAIVYFITEDSEETKKALYGCITGTVISTVLYVILVAASAGSAGYYY